MAVSVAAITLFICGCGVAIYGVREIGVADWRWLLAGLLIAEAGGLIFLFGWTWLWACGV